MSRSFQGLRPDNLLTYLAGLGLIRVVHAQLDPAATSWWEGPALQVASNADLVGFLVDRYRPTPVLSPWNGGSGYGDKDKASRAALERILTTGDARLADFVATDAALRRVPAPASKAEKGRYVQRLRNLLPDAALPWLDAAVVLTVDHVKGAVDPVYPPLLGTGGNDGRLDFSTNFHQRLADVLPELGAKRARSVQLLKAAFEAAEVPLQPATIGQFDPLAAGGPGTSSFDDTTSLTNPWLFVLMVEGLVQFASAPVRRLGETTSRAAQPFTVNHSAAGPIPGAVDEEARGELWAPVWEHPLTGREVNHLFSSARTSWNGHTATATAHMYAALKSTGIDRRADRFVRYGLYQRNGLAFSAVRLDTVAVEDRPEVELGIAIEQRMQPFLMAPETNRLAPVRHRFESARVAFYRDPTASTLLSLLALATEVERMTTVTESGREAVTRSTRRLSAAQALPLLEDLLRNTAEYRLAAALAAGAVRLDTGWWSMADLLIGRVPTGTHKVFEQPVVDGFGRQPLTHTLTALMRWRLTRRDDARPVTEANEVSGRAAGMSLLDRRALLAPWQDVHAWAQQGLDERELHRGLQAMFALDWAPSIDRPHWSASPVLPSPDLAVLQPFAQRNVTVGGFDQADRRGILPTWPSLLGADRPGEVLSQAVQLLNRASVILRGPTGEALARPASRFSTPAKTLPGHRLAAALWVPTNTTQALQRTTRLQEFANPDQEVVS